MPSAPHFSVNFGHATSAPVWDEHDQFMRYDYDAVTDLGCARVVGLGSYAEAITGACTAVAAFATEAAPGAVVMVAVGDWDGWSFMCRTWETPSLAIDALMGLLDDISCAV